MKIPGVRDRKALQGILGESGLRTPFWVALGTSDSCNSNSRNGMVLGETEGL